MSPSRQAPARFCLITSAHVSNNPRLVKEADALHAAGHAVRVVAMDVEPEASARDRAVMEGRDWRLERVAARRSGGPIALARWGAYSAAQRISRGFVRAGVGGRVWADRALSRYMDPLAAAGSASPADVVVAHNLDALPAAWRAARKLGARLVFDIEDFHSGDVPEPERHAALVESLRRTEAHYLPRCDALLASSEGIADEVVGRYAVRRPTVVLNAFRVSDRDLPATGAVGEGRQAPSLYWYSQTVGPGRGLEEAVAALALSGTGAHLYLRGRVSDDYRRSLEAAAEGQGVSSRLHFLAPAPADEMVALAAEHDVGLALEQPDTRNRQICVTNKLLTYLAAGVAVVATDTEGQRAVMAQAPGAGRLCHPGDASALADALREIFGTPAALAEAKRAASAAAARRFSWEREEGRLLEALDAVASPGGESRSVRASAEVATGSAP